MLSTTSETLLNPYACPTDNPFMLMTKYNRGNPPFQKITNIWPFLEMSSVTSELS